MHFQCTIHNFDSDDPDLGCPWCEISQVNQQLETELQRNAVLRAEMEKEVQRTADAFTAMQGARDAFYKASQWNQLIELELNNLRSRLEEAEEDMSIQGVRMGEAQETIYDLKRHLRAVLEHIAPMIKLYEPNLPEHPVIAAIREYLDKP